MATQTTEQKEDLQVTVFVHEPGSRDPKIARVSAEDTLAQALRHAGVEVGDDVVVLIGEPAGEPDLDGSGDEHDAGHLDAKVGDVAKGRHCHVHVHQCRQVRVSVNYESTTEDRKFSPARTIAQVRAWAIRKFKVADAAADKLVLELCDSDTRPGLEDRLGSLAQPPTCGTCFDLVLSEAVQG